VGYSVRHGRQVATVPFSDKPDWEFLGTHITHIPDAMYPWDRQTVKSIREHYDPDFFPVFRRMVFKSPAGGIHTFCHHGCAWHDERSHPDHLIMQAEFPSTGYGSDWGARFGHCNKVFWYQPSEDRLSPMARKYGIPGAFVPWGNWIVRMADETQKSAKSAAERIMIQREKGESARAARAYQSEREEAAYRQKQESAYQKRLIAEASVDDWKSIGAPSRLERQPFVDLGK
jgi:hypothetical protein